MVITTEENMQTLHIKKDIQIAAPIDITFSSVLAELGPEGLAYDGTPYPRVLEAWPGGRWFRDLGNNTGHFWGHIQVIKPPTLLEITGPMFMSYPAINFVQWRLSAHDNGTKLALTHRAIGLLAKEHREGVHLGWTHMSERVKQIAEARHRNPR